MCLILGKILKKNVVFMVIAVSIINLWTGTSLLAETTVQKKSNSQQAESTYKPMSNPNLLENQFNQEQDSEDSDLDYSDLYDENDNVVISDPLYYMNVALFHFNDKFYLNILKPVAKGYKKIVPKPVRTCTSNFFYNLGFPIRFVNNILQGKEVVAAGEFVAFAVNSTAGCLGLADLSKDIPNLKRGNEDFGQTLGKYGIGNGFFIELPFWGPSTLRDTIGLIGDFFLSPISYIESDSLRFGVTSLKYVNKTSFRIGEYQILKDAALSPYESFKTAYIQYRNTLIDK